MLVNPVLPWRWIQQDRVEGLKDVCQRLVVWRVLQMPVLSEFGWIYNSPDAVLKLFDLLEIRAIVLVRRVKSKSAND
jgi:hypothetical protein